MFQIVDDFLLPIFAYNCKKIFLAYDKVELTTLDLGSLIKSYFNVLLKIQNGFLYITCNWRPISYYGHIWFGSTSIE